MRVSVFLPPGRDALIVLNARAEEPGGALGDLHDEITPGQSFLGWSFEELKQLGTGMHDIDPKPGWKGGSNGSPP
jgi:hypothetical protein